jgi:hypothetical protein
MTQEAIIHFPTPLILAPADIFLTRSSSLLGRAIRTCTTDYLRGEKRSKVNHVGLVVSYGSIYTANVVEALIGVKKHTLAEEYGSPSKDDVAVFRPACLSDERKATVAEKAKSYVGRSYGWVKLATHFLDWSLGGVYLFRRMNHSDRYPICSWIVAYAYKEIGIEFGVDPKQADPDHIWDYCMKSPGMFSLVRPLRRLA